jgi:hypothetical protein
VTPQALSLPVPPGSSDEAPARTATHGCATSGPGGPTSPDDFTLACRALSLLFGRNHARQYQA